MCIMIKDMYSGVIMCVRMLGGDIGYSQIDMGLDQGSAPSPLLIITIMEELTGEIQD